MKRGSQFLWDLATWNQFGDDLRGVDSVSVVANGGTLASTPGPNDGVVSMTSASLAFAAVDGRTRIVNYCHVPLPPGLESAVLGCTGAGVANIDSSSHLSYLIIQSFLAGTNTWQTIGAAPSQDPILGTTAAAITAARNSKDQDLHDVTAATLGAVALSAGPSANPVTSVYYDDSLPPGTYTATVTSTSAGAVTANEKVAAGGYHALVVKQGPVISSVTSNVATGLEGNTVAAGSTIAIVGAGFDASSAVALAGAKLTISSQAPNLITAVLPYYVGGYQPLMVTNSAGQASIHIVVAPASTAAPALSLSQNTLTFSYIAGTAAPAAAMIGVTNAGGGFLVWSAAAGAPWLALTPSSATLMLTANPSGLVPGTYHSTVTLTAAGASNSPQTVSVTLTVSTAIVITSVTNAASSVSGAIVPSEIVSIKGAGLGPATGVSFTLNASGGVDTTLAGTRVFIGGIAAPLTYVSAGQINAIVPYELTGQSQASVQVTTQYQSAQLAQPLTVASAAPGIFTGAATGSGQILAANQDGTYNSSGNPAAKGSYVTMYFTGGGLTNPPGTTGSVNGTVLKFLTQLVSATVGGESATVTFAGAAPGLVDGVMQLNLRLAPGAASGTAQPVVLTIGGIAGTNAGTIAVQ